MLASCEAGEVFALLEGGAGGAGEAADALCAVYSTVREPWYVRGLLSYHARTGSTRALDLLARAPEPHAKFLLDALAEQLREPSTRRIALAVLAPLVARRPAWVHRVGGHAVSREAVRAARAEREPLPLVQALLALAALVPAAPAVAQPFWPDLADVLLRPAALQPPPSPATRAHLQLAQLALFHALYATHPCTLIETLRAELAASGAARQAWEASLQPLLGWVRLHPALVAGRRGEGGGRPLDQHDVVAETRRLVLHAPVSGRDTPPPAPDRRPATEPTPPLAGSGAAASLAAGALRPGAEPWLALADRCGADSAPHTPLPADTDATEPPEAAVEATPENTPAKETRAAFRFPTESSAVRAIGRGARKETSPVALPADGGGGGSGGRLARVLAERRAADSPVAFAPAPPPGALRPEPRAARPVDSDDYEVTQLTERALTDAWEAEAPTCVDPRRRSPPGRARGGALGRRCASCPRAAGRASVSVAVQTVDTWPQPYEFLLADLYRSLPPPPPPDNAQDSGSEWPRPCARLDRYLSELYSGGSGGAGGAGGGGVTASSSELSEQLSLAHAQLMFERWRRDAHSERNRRLLGRCRAARAHQLTNHALTHQIHQLTQERDELLALRQADLEQRRPEPLAGRGRGSREARLEAALAEEQAARARAEAALHEAEAARAQADRQLQRARNDAGEAARHLEALSGAARAAERRAEHVRRLRTELLVLAEREARLREATLAALARQRDSEAGTERGVRAAAARADELAAAAGARAEALAARAHDLEAALAARDHTLAAVRRAARAKLDEADAQQAALQDKCRALQAALRAAEGARLTQLAAAAPPRARPRPPSPPAPPAPPAASSPAHTHADS